MITSGFFDAKTLSSGGYDRVYNAETFAEYFHLLVANGVFPNPSDQLQVLAEPLPSMSVIVSPGFGWINGYYAKNDASERLIIQPADGVKDRIDSVVLRWQNSDRNIILQVLKGSLENDPVAPQPVRSGEIYDLVLATIRVSAGVTKIQQKDIKDTRMLTSLCGWVTGTVQSIDTETLYTQYEDAFQNWFAHIKKQLEGNVATNLQQQINNLTVSVNDKISSEQFKETSFHAKTGSISISNAPLDALYPESLLPCDGRFLAVSSYPELFEVLGVQYGATLKDPPIRPLGIRKPVGDFVTLLAPLKTSSLYVINANSSGGLYTEDQGVTWHTFPRVNIAYSGQIACNSEGTSFITTEKGKTWISKSSSLKHGQWKNCTIPNASLLKDYGKRVVFNEKAGKFYILCTKSDPENVVDYPVYLLVSSDASGEHYESFLVTEHPGHSLSQFTYTLACDGDVVVVHAGDTLLSSFNGGRTFQKVDFPVVSISTLSFGYPGDLWVLDSNQDLYFSKDEKHFTKVATLGRFQQVIGFSKDLAFYYLRDDCGFVTSKGALIPATSTTFINRVCKTKQGLYGMYTQSSYGLSKVSSPKASSFALPKATSEPFSEPSMLPYGQVFIHT